MGRTFHHRRGILVLSIPPMRNSTSLLEAPLCDESVTVTQCLLSVVLIITLLYTASRPQPHLATSGYKLTHPRALSPGRHLPKTVWKLPASRGLSQCGNPSRCDVKKANRTCWAQYIGM